MRQIEARQTKLFEENTKLKGSAGGNEVTAKKIDDISLLTGNEKPQGKKPITLSRIFFPCQKWLVRDICPSSRKKK